LNPPILVQPALKQPFPAATDAMSRRGNSMIALNQRYEGIALTLDGGTFHGCTFVRCRLRFNGLMLPELGGNKFEECEWDFIGPARDTLAFLQVLYHDHGGTDLVEKIFGLVRDRGSLARIGVV
jgi:hypothetical protein